MPADRKRNYLYQIVDTTFMNAEEAIAQLPDRLYKYSSVNDNLLASIQNSELYYNRPTRFNDPFDCQLEMLIGETLKDRLDALTAMNPKLVEDHKEALEASMANDEVAFKLLNQCLVLTADQVLGVTCFCEVNDQALLWAHYAHKHEGIALGFEPRSCQDLSSNLLPVRYHDEYPKFEFQDLIELTRRRQVLHAYATSKSADWDYEFEWRAIRDEGGDRLYAFAKPALKEVVFGLRCSPEDRAKVKETVENAGYKDLHFFKVQKVSSSYRVAVVELLE